MHLLSRQATLGVLLTTAAAAQPRLGARGREVLARLSTERQVAQLVMPWLLGNYAGFDADGLAQARYWVDSLRVGGIVISIGSPLDVAAKLNFLQMRSKIPLLVAADLEGGAAFRFTGATPFPTNMGVGATGREQDAFAMGRITGLEARAVGVHVLFAPVADVNNNPANPVINTRSFGGDPQAVGRLVRAAIRGSKAAGMLTTAKHFPGHGDTETDSHISLPKVRADWARLASLELVPFRAAITSGVDLVMTGHVAMTGFGDSTVPATLSPEVLTGVLRDSLRFRGVVVTDALDMGALVTAYGGGEAAVRAFLAGSDLLLMPANPREAIRAMVDAVTSGRISKRRLRQSVARVLALKERAGLFDRRTVSLGRIPRVVGRQAFLDTARAVAARSLVLVRDSGDVVARLRSDSSTVGLVVYGEVGWAPGLPAQLGKRGHRAVSFRLTPASGPASYDSARTNLTRAPVAVIAVAVKVTTGSGSIAMPAPLVDLIETSSRERPTVLISLGSPYLLSQAPSPQALLLGWTTGSLTEEAVANAFRGAAITGKLPIDLPPRYRIGDGIALPAIGSTPDANRR